MSGYHAHLLFLILTMLMFSSGMALTLNVAGLPNLSLVSAYGLGAYAYAILSARTSLPTEAIITLSIVSAAVLGTVVGLVTSRLRLDHFALMTLAIVVIARVLASNVVSLTGGPLGVFISRPFSLVGVTFNSPQRFALIVACTSVGFSGVLIVLSHSRYRTLLTSFRDDEMRLRSLGYNTALIRISVSVVAACLAAVAGVFNAAYLGYADPSNLMLGMLTPVLFVVALIGLPVKMWKLGLASIFVVIGPEAIDYLPIDGTRVGATRQLLLLIPLAAILGARLPAIGK